MVDSTARVGFVYDGTTSEEQRAALSWLRNSEFEVGSLTFDDLVRTSETDRSIDSPVSYDVLWWHRREAVESHSSPGAAEAFGEAAGVLDRYVERGGSVLLTLRAMAFVNELGVETVPPDVVERAHAGEPTGLLWRSLYDDHPVPKTVGSLRIPVREAGVLPSVRYEHVLPSNGAVLASTVRGERDVPGEMATVCWRRGAGTVLGIGSGLAFDDSVGALVETRNRLAAGVLTALAGGYDHPSRPKEAAELAAVRASIDDDPTRPVYHVTPPANWLNDPNGLIRWNGRYHLFYQYNPGGPFHNTMHWGHVVSDDLVTWADEPLALAPSPDGPDRVGCWSGCAVDDDGTPTLLYTGGRDRRQLPCLATADDDDLRRWSKHDTNPVIEGAPDDIAVLETEHWEAEFRDHCVWRESGTWYQLIGSGVVDRGGAALLYTSRDLHNWKYEGPLLVADSEDDGAVWECPELLDLGETQLLHVSNYEEVVYFLGELRDGEFAVVRRGTLDHGDFYAPQSLSDGDRTLTWGWLPEARDVSAQWDAGWSGALSLPRVLSLGEDGRLRQRPAREVEGLREAGVPVPDSVTLDAGERRTLEANGRALELEFEVALDDASAFELSVFESRDRIECTPIRYSRDGVLSVDRSTASADERTCGDTQRMDVPPYDESLSLRVFLDGSVVELFANERRCLTSRVYPRMGTGVSLAAFEGRATVESLSCWKLGEAFHPEPVE